MKSTKTAQNLYLGHLDNTLDRESFVVKKSSNVRRYTKINIYGM